MLFNLYSEMNSSSPSFSLNFGPTLMTPEMLVYSDDSWLPSDTYSFAVVIYLISNQPNELNDENSSGKHWWKNLFIFVHRICNSTRFVKVPEIPDTFRNLIQSCWNHNPQNRPIFSEIIQELHPSDELVVPGTNLERYTNKKNDDYTNENIDSTKTHSKLWIWMSLTEKMPA